jgi:hypothetical protein
MVFELQFTLFQAAQLQLVGMAVPSQHLDDSVEVAMFHVQFNNPAMDVLCVRHGLLFQAVLLQKRCGASA